MTSFETQSDAGFYELVHRILMRSDVDAIRERRIRPRMSFDTHQRIAPCDNKAPSGEDFFPVRCFDLNKGGLAFFLDSPPSFKRLVVELTCPQRKIYILAEVAHFAPVLLFPNGEIILEEAQDIFDEEEVPGLGEPTRTFLIGCRFLSRWQPCHEQTPDSQR